MHGHLNVKFVDVPLPPLCVRISTSCSDIYLYMYVCTMMYSCNRDSNTQHDHPTTCVITQEYSSTTLSHHTIIRVVKRYFHFHFLIE